MNRPELRFPQHLIEKATRSDNEFGWKEADVLNVIEAAKQMQMATIGGQVQYVFPDATCELYWLSYDSEDRKRNEDWVTFCSRTAIECSEKFKQLETIDIEKEAIKTFGILKIKQQSGVNLSQYRVFILYFIDKETYSERFPKHPILWLFNKLKIKK